MKKNDTNSDRSKENQINIKWMYERIIDIEKHTFIMNTELGGVAVKLATLEERLEFNTKLTWLVLGSVVALAFYSFFLR